MLTLEVHPSCVMLWSIKCWCTSLLAQSKAACPKPHAVVNHTWKAQLASQLILHSLPFTVPEINLVHVWQVSQKPHICLLCSLWHVVHRTDCDGG